MPFIKPHKNNVSNDLIIYLYNFLISCRLDTDMIFGNACGFNTLFVLSGEHKLSDIENLENSNDPHKKKQLPNYCMNSLADILSFTN